MKGMLFEIPLTEKLPDLTALLRAQMPGTEKATLWGRRGDLDVHLDWLTTEFAGESQINFFHAALNVLVRRDVQKALAFRHFEALWRRQGEHLLSSLSARWLVSACDTIMDCAEDGAERAIACAGSMFMNTIKLYETERLSNGHPRFSLGDLREPTPLFDGMTSFAVGSGDMVRNLRSRARLVCSGNTTAARILLELVKRADHADTVYRRLAVAHTIEETRWV